MMPVTMTPTAIGKVTSSFCLSSIMVAPLVFSYFSLLRSRLDLRNIDANFLQIGCIIM